MSNPNIQKLKEDVKFLGTLLGNIIKEQEGEWLFNLEEEVRRTSIEMNEKNYDELCNKLNGLISGKSNQELELLARAFTTYFRLVNLAENIHRARRIREYELSSNSDKSRDSLGDLFKRLNFKDQESTDFLNFLKILEIVPTITAHPTEANRRTILEKNRRLFFLMLKLDRESLTPFEYDNLVTMIKAEITSLWQTNDIRLRKLQVMDEVNTGLFYLDSVFYDAIGELFKKIQLFLSENTS